VAHGCWPRRKDGGLDKLEPTIGASCGGEETSGLLGRPTIRAKTPKSRRRSPSACQERLAAAAPNARRCIPRLPKLAPALLNEAALIRDFPIVLSAGKGGFFLCWQASARRSENVESPAVRRIRAFTSVPNEIMTQSQDLRSWTQILGRYREPDVSRSVFELLITATPFVALWALMWAALSIGYWLCLLLAFPTACFLMRLFMIQHDCGHGTCFRRRATNDWVGRIIGVVTLAPYDFWLRTHAAHHANAGNLDHRGMGDIITLTVDEYLLLPSLRRLAYRLYRNPVIMFGLIPTYVFVLHYRLPIGLMRAGRQPWLSTMGTNAAIAGAVALMILLIGIGPFLLVQGPVVVISASIAVWFFYVQHQFEDTVWARDGQWSFHEAALRGSSHYELPPALAWFTGNIGVHHVHHLSSRIPFYRLPQVLRDHPQLASLGRVTFLQSLKARGSHSGTRSSSGSYRFRHCAFAVRSALRRV
jgi:omega-6 fatty acid desaturase (delta-12 desaturase)